LLRISRLRGDVEATRDCLSLTLRRQIPEETRDYAAGGARAPPGSQATVP
jgi:hypothetical protein